MLFFSKILKANTLFIFIIILVSCKKKDVEVSRILPASIEIIDNNKVERHEYFYNEKGLPTEIKYYTDNIATSKRIFEYDNNNQLIRLKLYTEPLPTMVNYNLFTYTSDGHISKKILLNNNDIDLGSTFEYEYSNNNITKQILSGYSAYQRFEYDNNKNIIKIFQKDNISQERLEIEVLKYDNSKKGIFSGLNNNLQIALLSIYNKNIFYTHISNYPVDYKYTSASNNIYTFGTSSTFNTEGYPTQITYTSDANNYWNASNVIINITYKK